MPLVTPVSASASHNNAGAGVLINESFTDLWSSNSGQNVGMWIGFDLGASMAIDRVVLWSTDADYLRNGAIVASDTGVFGGEEVQLTTFVHAGTGIYTIATGTVAPYRYWRIACTAFAGGAWWKAAEVQFITAAPTALPVTDDFSSSTTGAARPASWMKSATTPPWTVTEDGTCVGGKKIVQAGPSNTQHWVLWQEQGSQSGTLRLDARIKTSDSNGSRNWFEAVLRGPLAGMKGSTNAPFYGLRARGTGPGVGQVTVHKDNSADTATAALAFNPTNAWVRIALAYDDSTSTLMGKCWQDGGLEPGWQASVVISSPLASGYAGFIADVYGAPDHEVDWAMLSPTLVPPPAAPSDLVATVIDYDQVDLEWVDNSSDETGFKIYRAEVVGGLPGAYSLIHTTAAGAESWSDLTVSELTTYRYYVVATNAGGDSAASNTDDATTPASNTPPGVPVFVSPAAGGNVRSGTIITWTKGVDPDVGDTVVTDGQLQLNGGGYFPWFSGEAGTSRVLPPGLTPGALDAQIRSNDGTDPSGWVTRSFTVVAAPVAPTVAVTVHFNFATIAGPYSGDAPQGGRRYRVYDAAGVVLVWDSGWVTPPSTSYPDVPLDPNTDYNATIEDKDELGQSSGESAQEPFSALDYPDVQVTQAGLAARVMDTAPEAHATQAVTEVGLGKAGNAEARVTQVVLETMLPHEQVVYQSYPCCLLLEHYQRDRTTVDWSVTTAPNQPNSFLRDPIQDGGAYAAQEVDMAEGRASISSVKVSVIDKALPGGNQQDRWLTKRLADGGIGAVMGHRERLRRFIDPVRGWVTVADGPASAPRLRPSYSGYEWEIRDCRDNERRLPAFLKCTDRTILPLGTLNGWGHLPDGSHLVPAAVPIVGTTYGADGGYNCGIDFSALWSGATAPEYLEITEAFLEAVKATPPSGAASGDPMSGTYYIDIFWRFLNVEIWWRAAGTNDPWNVVNPNERIGSVPPLGQGSWLDPYLVVTEDGTIGSTGRRGACLKQVFLTDLHGGNSVPLANGQSLEVLFVYVGKPTEANPLLIDGMTAGQLLKALYDGEYTPDENGLPTPTGILYDTTALLKMTTPVLACITEPCDDLRDWAEKQVYAPTGYAPCFDNYLRISPLSQVPPATTAGLVDLTNAITAPAPSWQHGDRVINDIRFTYRRFYPDSTAKAGFGVREITEEYRQEDSVDTQGEKPMEIDTVVFGAIGTGAGVALAPEVGAALAKLRNDVLIPRYAWGTPTATLRCFRSATYALRPGNFALAHPTWMPHYPTGQRGMSALVQVLEARDLSCAWREFVVEVVSDAAELPESLETRKGFVWLGLSGGFTITGTQGA